MKSGLFTLTPAILAKQKTPLKITFILTFNCNLSCNYCNPKKHVSAIIAAEKALSAIHEFAKLGTKQINFIGGEPLLHKRFGDFLKTAKTLGLKTVMHSNLTLLSEKNTEVLEHLDAAFVCINGPQVIHDKIRGSGEYEVTMRGIELLKKYNILVIIDYIITSLNSKFEHLDHVMNLAKALDLSVGFQPVFNHELAKIDNAELNEKELSISTAKIQSIFSDIQKHYVGSKHLYNSAQYISSMAKQSTATSTECHMGDYSYLVDMRGNVARCYKYLLDLHNNFNGFQIGWDQAFAKTDKRVCSECSYSTHIEDTNYIESLLCQK